MLARRHFLTAATAGLGLLAAGCSTDNSSGTSAQPSVPPVSTVPPAPGAGELKVSSFQLFTQEDLNFQSMIALGASGISAAVGEVLTAVNQANAAPGGASYQSVYDAWIASGNLLTQQADEALKAGHKVTASARYMRAAQYYNQALFWVLGTSTPGAEAQVYGSMNAAWTAANSLARPAPESVSVPYEDHPLPGWFFSGGSGTRPVVIMNNGSDGQNVDMLAEGGDAALERGYHVFIFEGPGQGSMLFEHNIVFRPDWEKVITPIVDYLGGRDDVDKDKIVLHGISLGGYFVARAAAYEHRLAAVIADPGLDSSWRAFPESIKKIAEAGPAEVVNKIWADDVIAGASPQESFALRKRLEIYTAEAHDEAAAGQIPTDWYGISRRVQEFTLSPEQMAAITSPTLVTDYVEDIFFGDGPTALYDGLTVEKKKFIRFGETNGAQYHDAPVASQYVGEVILDWVDETIGYQG
ncbi:alpha/beta fold hydrolase [Gordonia desulfuricans]|uniref:Alpha/beta fold hydrolase n=1 Tax=Gordonia desulfuricans TaxID=89051 RepID=A0A7K3LVT0_9ACTN|nr:alpha/beta fold hydrolase [Gordonia desulfuricans]NDK92398.1 alpha/beta fold hydrolase [Gordonia desulfuricans]